MFDSRLTLKIKIYKYMISKDLKINSSASQAEGREFEPRLPLHLKVAANLAATF